MAQASVNIVYVKDRNGQVTAEIENGSMDMDKSVGEILRLLGSMKHFGPGAQLFIAADPVRKLSELGIQTGSTIIVMGTG
jgi:hypothetical protein